MSSYLDESRIIKAMQAEIQKQVEENFEKVIKEATEKFEAQLRSNLGHIALKLIKNYEVYSAEGTLTIKVKHEQ